MVFHQTRVATITLQYTVYKPGKYVLEDDCSRLPLDDTPSDAVPILVRWY